MVIFDENDTVITDPDLEAGYLTYETMKVTHNWVVDSPEEGEIVVIAEYPNGGKDTEWQVTKPEEGHFDTRDEDGNEVEHFDGEIPDDFPHDVPNPGSWTFARYILYTEEELSAMAEEKAENEYQVAVSTQTFAAIPMMVQLNSAAIPDAQAATIPLLFKKWTPGETYKKDEIIRYENSNARSATPQLYRIGQPELTASDIYKPGDTGTEALYSHIVIDEEGYEEWKAWDGVTGLYQEGDIRRDPTDGQLYICKGDNCTYGPPHSTPDWWDLYTE